MVMRTVGPLDEEAWGRLERALEEPHTEGQKMMLEEAKKRLAASSD
ncbi:MAG: hypothetical protein MPI95_05965 [Nitrosopumilus sp.]|nr:hypothetical protein [Nitrosopumilus sp.]CAI9831271.1 hypothetical protein IBTHAUMO2_220014 [Nitrosopumilaceae archaeon]MDA7941899.1 hypothetical protein [Nitrosopumilus sp.]MDA7943473.1 hypothetical protein [Nitrosopumilus sp.]MDA7945446.1 hypothetical protein [Nitrosopumilus sp.]